MRTNYELNLEYTRKIMSTKTQKRNMQIVLKRSLMRKAKKDGAIGYFNQCFQTALFCFNVNNCSVLMRI